MKEKVRNFTINGTTCYFLIEQNLVDEVCNNKYVQKKITNDMHLLLIHMRVCMQCLSVSL
jgi:hypothetical protein